jgi:quinol monooxygenase YgiN
MRRLNSTGKSSKLLTVILTANAEKQTEFQQTLEALRLQIAAAPGCTECMVTREVSGAPRFILFLVFRDQRSLEAQLASDNFRVLRGAMDILSEPAEFRMAAADSAPGFSL